MKLVINRKRWLHGDMVTWGELPSSRRRQEDVLLGLSGSPVWV